MMMIVVGRRIVATAIANQLCTAARLSNHRYTNFRVNGKVWTSVGSGCTEHRHQHQKSTNDFDFHRSWPPDLPVICFLHLLELGAARSTWGWSSHTVTFSTIKWGFCGSLISAGQLRIQCWTRLPQTNRNRYVLAAQETSACLLSWLLPEPGWCPYFGQIERPGPASRDWEL